MAHRIIVEFKFNNKLNTLRFVLFLHFNNKIRRLIKLCEVKTRKLHRAGKKKKIKWKKH